MLGIAIAVALTAWWRRVPRSVAPTAAPEHAFAEGRSVSATKAAAAPADEVRVAAWLDAGELEQALAALASLPADAQERWLRAIAERWMRDRPREAAVLAEALRAAGDERLFSCAIEAWTATDAAAVAAYARGLPSGSARATALETAVRAGTLQNPAAVAAWLPQLRDAAEFDRAATYLVAHTDPLFRPTAQAREWAELIRDPALRAEALGAVVREWAERDRTAATEYVAQDGVFSPDERRALLATLTPRPEAQ